MQTIKLDAHIGSDGKLKLELPLGFADEDVEVLVVIQPKEKRNWPPGYFERTAGALADDPIKRHPLKEYED